MEEILRVEFTSFEQKMGGFFFPPLKAEHAAKSVLYWLLISYFFFKVCDVLKDLARAMEPFFS